MCEDPSVGFEFSSDKVALKGKRNDEMIKNDPSERRKKLLLNNQFTYINQVKEEKMKREDMNILGGEVIKR